MRRRLSRLLTTSAVLVSLGLAYALWLRLTGLFFHCPFRLLTGLKCPGCGVTHVCLALMRLDFRTAWAYNAGLVASLPLLAVLGLASARRYVLGLRETKLERWLGILLLAWLLIWGLLRNAVLHI